MKSSYKYHIDRYTMILSIIIIVAAILGVWALYDLYIGGYISAWFASIIIAIILLMVLSIPRRIALVNNAIEIQCVSDITIIPIDEVEQIRIIPSGRTRWFIPLLGVVGFFGYYGKFLDLKRFRIITLYASEWNHFVEIKTIYNSRIYISCREAETLIHAISQAQAEAEAMADN